MAFDCIALSSYTKSSSYHFATSVCILEPPAQNNSPSWTTSPTEIGVPHPERLMALPSLLLRLTDFARRTRTGHVRFRTLDDSLVRQHEDLALLHAMVRDYRRLWWEADLACFTPEADVGDVLQRSPIVHRNSWRARGREDLRACRSHMDDCADRSGGKLSCTSVGHRAVADVEQIL